MTFCLWALFKDIVQHHTPSKVFLFQGFAQASLYFMGAILAVRKGDVEVRPLRPYGSMLLVLHCRVLTERPFLCLSRLSFLVDSS